MIHKEYSKKYNMKGWILSCITVAILNKMPFSEISEKYKISTSEVIRINALVVNNFSETTFIKKQTPFEFAYWETECQMKMPNYNEAILTGEELLIKNKIISENLSFSVH